MIGDKVKAEKLFKAYKQAHLAYEAAAPFLDHSAREAARRGTDAIWTAYSIEMDAYLISADEGLV